MLYPILFLIFTEVFKIMPQKCGHWSKFPWWECQHVLGKSSSKLLSQREEERADATHALKPGAYGITILHPDSNGKRARHIGMAVREQTEL